MTTVISIGPDRPFSFLEKIEFFGLKDRRGILKNRLGALAGRFEGRQARESKGESRAPFFRWEK